MPRSTRSYYDGGMGVEATRGAESPDEVRAPNSATLVVDLPAAAQLTIDGKTTRSTSGQRTFFTPALEAGKEYSYQLRAELVQNGKKFVVTKNADIHPGRTTRVRLDFADATVAQK
jgi:uncharacterized protein (TIGR03000 family)